MFEIGDVVVRANKGICEVKDITHMDVNGTDPDKLYYVMVPVLDRGAKLFIPTDIGDKTYRYAMNRDQAEDIIRRVPEIHENWVDNHKHREDNYKEAIKSNNPEQLVGIIKNIYVRKQDRLTKGKKSLAVDDRYFKLAEDLLYSELAFAIGCKKDEIPEMIEEKIAS